MLRGSLIFIGAVVAASAEGQEAAAWATVPASRQAQQLEAFTFPPRPTEEVVTLVRPKGAVVALAKVPSRVFSLEIPSRPARPTDAPVPTMDSTSAIPAGAFWPGADGRIAMMAPEPGAATIQQTIRNPWEIRIRQKSALPDSVFVCGGIIAGGDAAAVAFVNGRIAARGDVLDGFMVDEVAASAVVLKRNGALYVLPLGKRTAISRAEP
jgi:hypothetical protein